MSLPTTAAPSKQNPTEAERPKERLPPSFFDYFSLFLDYFSPVILSHGAVALGLGFIPKLRPLMPPILLFLGLMSAVSAISFFFGMLYAVQHRQRWVDIWRVAQCGNYLIFAACGVLRVSLSESFPKISWLALIVVALTIIVVVVFILVELDWLYAGVTADAKEDLVRNPALTKVICCWIASMFHCRGGYQPIADVEEVGPLGGENPVQILS